MEGYRGQVERTPKECTETKAQAFISAKQSNTGYVLSIGIRYTYNSKQIQKITYMPMWHTPLLLTQLVPELGLELEHFKTHGIATHPLTVARRARKSWLGALNSDYTTCSLCLCSSTQKQCSGQNARSPAIISLPLLFAAELIQELTSGIYFDT